MFFLRSLYISLIALVLIGVSSQAQENGPVEFLPVKENCHIKVEGTSTMHNWESESNMIEGFIKFDMQPAKALQALKDHKINGIKLEASVNIPANSFKSHSSAMDKNMFTALKAQEYPEITYKFLTGQPINGMNDQQHATLETKGDLTIAGVKHTITLPLEIKKLSDNEMEITGHYKLKMTDYGITIPKFLFGMVQTGDIVEVSWDWMISLK